MYDDDLYAAAISGNAEAIAILEREADILSHDIHGVMGNILHYESWKGNTDRVRFILRQFPHKNLLVKLSGKDQTPIHWAAYYGNPDVIEVLIDECRNFFQANSDSVFSSFEALLRHANCEMDTALSHAVMRGYLPIAKMLVEADPSDPHIPNHEGRTPMYIAAERGHIDILKLICTTCTAPSFDGPGGSTALHAVILNFNNVKEEDRDVISMIIDAASRRSIAKDDSDVSFRALFDRTDNSGRSVLELAVHRNYVDVVKLILIKYPAIQSTPGHKTNELMRLANRVMDKECKDIDKLLSETYDEIDPDHQGALALILAIKSRDRESLLRLLRDAKHLVTFAGYKGWTSLHYAAYHEFDSILDAIIEAQKDLGYQFVYDNMVQTPLLIAAEKRYTSTVIRLMELWPASSSAYTVVNKIGRNILHLAAAENKKEMIQGILKYCPEKYKEKLLKQQDVNGDTPFHLLISRGCFIPELIKHKGLDTMARNKRNWTPRDMLYFEDDIIADQVQIKIALDDVQTTHSWKFWGKSMEKKMDILESSVLPSKRERKDVLFNRDTKLLIDEKNLRMKKDLERYKKRTNTQIIVTALITTVTFTVGFTMPGGLRQSGEEDEGLVILSKKAAFNAFMVSDALALLLSTSSLFFYFLESMNEDPHQVSKLNAASTVLNIVSVMAMMLTFIAGTYVVLSHSPALAITVCIIGSLFFFLIIVLSIKIVYSGQVKRNKD